MEQVRSKHSTCNLQPKEDIGMKRWFPLLPVVALALLTACSPKRSGDALAAAEHLAATEHLVVTEQTQALPAACPVTQLPDPPFTPPKPYGAPLEGEFWFGSPALWTSLPVDGAWRDLPLSRSGYTQKLAWWREGYDWQAEPEPDLIVTGRRLDGEAPPLAASKATNAFAEDIGSAMLVGVDIPAAGCWEITGRYGEQELSFIIQVISPVP
jgi:hypothetical protein